MEKLWRVVKGYIFWTFERGSFHYDVMVTLILFFIFLAPRFVDFKDQSEFRDQPAKNPPHPTRLEVIRDGDSLMYQVDASLVEGQDDAMVRGSLLREITPVSGEVTISRTEAVRDNTGHIVAYRAWVRR